MADCPTIAGALTFTANQEVASASPFDVPADSVATSDSLCLAVMCGMVDYSFAGGDLDVSSPWDLVDKIPDVVHTNGGIAVIDDPSPPDSLWTWSGGNTHDAFGASFHIPTAAGVAGIVQHARRDITGGNVVLDDPPTVGSMLVMVLISEGALAGGGDVDGFTKRYDEDWPGVGTSRAIQIWTRCVETGDGDTWNAQHMGNFMWSFLLEIELTDVDPGTPPTTEPHPWEPQEPAHALVEIYVPDPDAYRWGEATWGDPSVWSSARWTDVTPEHVQADLIWGTSRADAGILATPEAGVYTFNTYDPDRKLDPGNAESPYAPEIQYGLPIRVTHRGVPIRTGYVESVAYDHASRFGEIRATDNIAALAGVTFPSDVEIASTLFARARDVIAACGLPVTVAPTPATGDPDVADWLEDGDFTAWHIIYHTALEALHLPWIDHLNVLQFRPWLHPSDRGTVIGSPELVNLVTYTSADSLYSVVQAMDAATETMIERRVTPLPRYGSRTHKRTIRTLDAGDWADIILEDRSFAGTRYRPGDVVPLDADSVEYHARRKIGEAATIDYPEADPDVEVRGRILGMRVRVVDLGGTVGPDWRYNYAIATASLSPLEADGVSPIEYLTDDDTGELLYPDGVVGLEG